MSIEEEIRMRRLEDKVELLTKTLNHVIERLHQYSYPDFRVEEIPEDKN